MIVIVNILGWIGSILLIAAYFLNSKDKITAQSIEYQSMNIIGSIFLVVNTVYFGAYPSSVVNIIWVFIGMYYLYQLNLEKNEKKTY